MISHPDARRWSPNPARDAARKTLADSYREMRRAAYTELPDNPFVGHAVARAMFRLYRSRQMQLDRFIMEGQRHGQKIH